MSSTSPDMVDAPSYSDATVLVMLHTLLRQHGPLTIAKIRAGIVPENAWPEERRIIRATAHRLAMDDASVAYDESTGMVRLRD